MAGRARITADGVLGTSGAQQRVFSFNFLSGGGPGVVVLRNGTAITDTEAFRVSGMLNETTRVSFGTEGKHFPAGCYVDIDADVQYVDLDYVQLSS